MDEFLSAFAFESDIERDRAVAILERVGSHEGTPCPGCGRVLVGQEVVESVVLGYQDAPRCHPCLAAAHDEDADEFFVRMGEYVDRVACFRATWEWTGAHGGAIAPGDPGRTGGPSEGTRGDTP